MIPADILKEIADFNKPPSPRKIYTDEIHQVMSAALAKGMKWESIIVLLIKHYPTVPKDAKRTNLSKNHSQWKAQNASKQMAP